MISRLIDFQVGKIYIIINNVKSIFFIEIYFSLKIKNKISIKKIEIIKNNCIVSIIERENGQYLAFDCYQYC